MVRGPPPSSTLAYHFFKKRMGVRRLSYLKCMFSVTAYTCYEVNVSIISATTYIGLSAISGIPTIDTENMMSFAF